MLKMRFYNSLQKKSLEKFCKKYKGKDSYRNFSIRISVIIYLLCIIYLYTKSQLHLKIMKKSKKLFPLENFNLKKNIIQ